MSCKNYHSNGGYYPCERMTRTTDTTFAAVHHKDASNDDEHDVISCLIIAVVECEHPIILTSQRHCNSKDDSKYKKSKDNPGLWCHDYYTLLRKKNRLHFTSSKLYVFLMRGHEEMCYSEKNAYYTQ